MAIISDYSTGEAGSYITTLLYGDVTLIGQSIVPSANYRVTFAFYYLSRFGSPGGNVYAKIYAATGTHGGSANISGSALATSDAVSASSLATGGGFGSTSFVFSGANAITLTSGTTYILALEYSGGDSSNYVITYIDNSSPADPGNMVYTYQGTNYAFPEMDALHELNGTLLNAPVASFNASATSGNASLNVTFTDTSTNTPTSWLWNFGNGNTSTLQNPSHSFATGVFNVTLTATNADGSDVSDTTVISVNQALIQTSTLSNPPTLYAPTLTTADPPPPPPTDWSAIGRDDDKEFLYKVYDSAGVYVGAWTDAKDNPEFSQRINTPGTTTTVHLARSATTRTQSFDYLVDELGNQYVDESGNAYVTTDVVPTTIGPGTDVDLNHRVDIYVVYGGFEYWVDELGNQYVDDLGNPYVLTYGAPNGTRIFSGFILDYTPVYGDEDQVAITLASYGYELSHQVIKSGSNTTVTFTTTPIETTVKSILDTDPGVLTYNAESIEATGVSPTLKFQLNSKLEGIESAFKQTDAGWYWFGHVGENLLYLKEQSATPDHTFVLGYHIKNFAPKHTMEGMVNDYYFLGGNTIEGDDSTMVFKHYTDTPSLTSYPRRGLRRDTDRRYTVDASIAARAGRILDEFSDPNYTAPLTVSSGRYDIESIRLGQLVGFANFGNYIDDLQLQIVSVNYTPYALTMELGKVQMRQVDAVADVQQSLENEQYEAVPTAPS